MKQIVFILLVFIFSIFQSNAQSQPLHSGDFEILQTLISKCQNEEWKKEHGWKIDGSNDTIPEDFYFNVRLTEGRITWLSLTHFDTLPDEIENLDQLETLNLNKVAHFSDALGRLSKLKNLKISNSALNHLPSALIKLDSLIYLDISYNQFDHIPSVVCNLQNLETIEALSNQIRIIPKDLNRLLNLKSLDFANNEIVTIESGIFSKLKKLFILDLSENKLKKLPHDINHMNRLSEMFLGGNQLFELPENFGDFPALTELSLANNQLTSLPESIEKMVSIEHLNLYGNQLSTLPKSIGHLTELKEFCFA